MLADVSLDLAPGERVALLGRSGAGKSSLALALAGLVPPTAGSVQVDGHEASARESRQAVASRIGILFQNPATQLVTSRVADEIALALENLGWPSGRIRSRVIAVLAELGLQPLALRAPHTLSGGEMQRVALAAALAPEPRYLLLDEPISHLDREAASEVESWIEVVAARTGAMRLTLAPTPEGLAGRVPGPSRAIVLDLGAVAHDGEWPLPAALAARLAGADEPIARELSREISPVAPGCRLAARGLSAGWEGRPVVRGVDLELAPGEVVTLEGPTGSGKSTLLLTLSGLLEPIAGSVSVAPSAPLRERVSCVLQFAERLFYRPSVREELADWNPSPGAVIAALGLLGLEPAILDRSPFGVSGGEARRLALAAGLLARRPVLLLDEPGMGLDGPGRRVLVRLIRSFTAAGGTLLLAAHDPELLALGTTRLQVSGGRLAEV